MKGELGCVGDEYWFPTIKTVPIVVKIYCLSCLYSGTHAPAHRIGLAVVAIRRVAEPCADPGPACERMQPNNRQPNDPIGKGSLMMDVWARYKSACALVGSTVAICEE